MDVQSTNQQSALATQSASERSMTGLSQNFDSFLTLLTAQLQHQDPLSPMDTSDFTNQLVLFAGVEQQILQNSNLESLIAVQLVALQNSVAIGAVSFIGKEIEASGRTAMLQEGSARFIYALPQAASSAVLKITDANGQTVLLTSAETTTGPHEFLWDGRDNLGNLLPDGQYTITVEAFASDGQPIEPAYTITGRVTNVRIEEDTVMLGLGDIEIPLSKLTRIREGAKPIEA